MKLSRAFCCGFAAALTIFAVSLRAADETPASGKKPLPSAKEILERYAKAIGGKEAFMKHESQHATGKVQMPAQQVSGTMNVYAARPNKLLMTMAIPGAGEITTGFDGKVAWTSSGLTGTMLMEGKMRDEIATQADFDHTLHDPGDYKTMEVLGTETFQNEECYKVKLVHRTGFDSIEYFSVKTGLQRGFTARQESPLGPITVTSTVTDYKQFGDLFLPSRVSQKALGVDTVMTIETMEYDNVDPAKFALPADVQALLEQPADQPQPPKEKEVSAPAADKNPKSEEKK